MLYVLYCTEVGGYASTICRYVSMHGLYVGMNVIVQVGTYCRDGCRWVCKDVLYVGMYVLYVGMYVCIVYVGMYGMHNMYVLYVCRCVCRYLCYVCTSMDYVCMHDAWKHTRMRVAMDCLEGCGYV